MPVYQYTAVDSKGKKVSGTHDADNPRHLRDALKARGVFVTEFHEGKEKKPAGSGLSREIQMPWEGRVKPQDISIFTRQLATQQRAGIPLAACLSALVEQIEEDALKSIVADIKQKVNEGSALAAAMSDHPKAFSPLYINMIRAGESSGSLDIVLLRLADFLEDQGKLRSKVTSAMVYPILMIVVSMGVVGFMMSVVVPRITEIYADQGQTLPFITRALIGLSSFFSSWKILVVIAAVVGGIWYFRRWRATDEGRARWDRFVLDLPQVGTIARTIAMARFSRTLATLLSSGVQLLPALDIVKNILGNTVLVRVVEQARLNIREGESIAVPLKRSGEFPPMVTHMITIGEQTGELEAMLDNVADTYETQVEAKLEGLTSIVEPAMIVLMGLVVGIIVFAIIQPILQLSQGGLG